MLIREEQSRHSKRGSRDGAAASGQILTRCASPEYRKYAGRGYSNVICIGAAPRREWNAGFAKKQAGQDGDEFEPTTKFG